MGALRKVIRIPLGCIRMELLRDRIELSSPKVGITEIVYRAEPVVASCDKVDIFIIYILSTDTV